MSMELVKNQGQQKFISKLNNLIGQVDHLMDQTEDYYKLIYEYLPVIEQNIDLTVQETSILINYFTNVDEADGEEVDQRLMFHALEEIKENFQQISQLLLDKKQIDNILELFLESDDRGISFERLLKLSQKIESILKDVNDIALNAIIFAAHLGDRGNGFRVISDNIHSTAKILDEEFVKIAEIIDSLATWHRSFQASINEIASGQREAVQFVEEIDQLFSTLTESLQMINTMLQDLMENVQDVIAPFQNLMVIIQRQDIIWQSLDNFRKALSLLKEKYVHYMEIKKDAEPEELYDHILFLHQGTNLINRLIKSVFGDLDQSLDEILHDMSQLLQALQGVQEDAAGLTGFFSGEESSLVESSGMVNFSFDQVFEFVQKFLALLRSMNKEVKELSQDKKTFDQNFERMETSVTVVGQQVERLNKIKILARIELARMSAQNDSYGQRIGSVVDNAIKTVTENNSLFFQLKAGLDKDLQYFERLILKNQERINQAIGDVNTSFEELEVTNDIINQTIYALFDEIDKLYLQVRDVNEKLQQAQHLKTLAVEIQHSFLQVSEDIHTEMEVQLSRCNIKREEVKNHELQEIFQLFTTYLERYVAKDFAEDEGFDVGSGEGELTLF